MEAGAAFLAAQAQQGQDVTKPLRKRARRKTAAAAAAASDEGGGE